MKKLLIVTLGLIMTTNLMANPIDLNKAKQIAATFLQKDTPKLVKQARRNAKAKQANLKYQDVSPYYIFSRGENQGFVIVSGDDCVPQVLGYTEIGDFEEDNLPPFLTWYLGYYAGIVEAAQATGNDAEAYAAPPMYASRQDIAPMIKTHWHQTAPYNDKCPTRKDGGGRCVTGCVATAASQVIYYWWKDLPHETQGSTSSYVYGDQANPTTAFPKGTQLKWELMLPQYGSEPAEFRDAVSTLLAVVGGGAGLTYGSSTAGYNDNCRAVFSNIFNMNGGTENAKDWGEEYNNYSDEAWSTLIYNDLIKQRPVLYSGCNSAGEGHAVVIDGYQSSTGYFHFNLGWGNPGAYDGYFTVARGKSPSWGFNDAWQECVTGVYPKKQNLKAEIELPYKMYANRSNKVKAVISNHGTLDYSGVYIFTNTTGKKPTSLSDAKDKNTDFVFSNNGEKAELTFSVKPTLPGNIYVIITDKNLNVITQTPVEVVNPESELWLLGMRVDGSSDVEKHNGEDYVVVYNEKAPAVLTYKNRSYVPYEGSPRLAVYCSEDDGATFNYVGYKSAKISVDANSIAEGTFNLNSTSSCPIEVGKLYYATIVNPIAGTRQNDTIYVDEKADTIIRFTLKSSQMEAVSFEDGCLAVKGVWDVNMFQQLAKKSAYKTATSYDLTGVTSIGTVPTLELNPNALFYVAEESTAKGKNVVKAGVCEELYLTPGYNFAPHADFTALKATLNIAQKPSKWYLLTTPCDLTVPSGIFARHIIGHTSTGISNKTEDAYELKAGLTYIIMATSNNIQELTGTNSNVVATLGENADTAVVGTFVATATPAGAMLPNDEETQWFDPVEVGTAIDAFRGYFCASNLTKRFRAYSSIGVDPSYLALSQSIESAYAVIEQLCEAVTPEATSDLLDSIRVAEEAFTSRQGSASDTRAAANSLLALIENYKTRIVDPGNKIIDVTDYIQNPSFETGRSTGWTTTASVRSVNTIANTSSGCDGEYVLYACQTDSTGVGVSQVLTGLTPGYYRLTAMLATSPGRKVTLFAGDSIAEVAASKYGKYYMTEAIVDEIYVGEDGELEIGVKAGDWYKADDFHLYFIGANEITDIEEVELFNDNVFRPQVKGIFDMQGRQLKSIERSGLYIVDGKKIFVK